MELVFGLRYTVKDPIFTPWQQFTIYFCSFTDFWKGHMIMFHEGSSSLMNY